MTQPIDKLLAGIARVKSPTERERNASARMGWITNPDERSLIERAAEARNISVNAFARRAVVAMACASLGIDFYDFMEDQKARPVRTYHPFVKVNTYGRERVVRGRLEGSENGRGAGPWRIRAMD